jgi:NAD(P)H-hydrate epimerase
MLAGEVTVADIGVDTEAATIVLVDDDDVVARLPRRHRDAHKWQSAVGVVAGSPGMVGAAVLSASGASHAGAGMVRLLSPAADDSFLAPGPWPTEAVRVPIGPHGWAAAALAGLERCAVAVVGPGLGRDEPTRAEIRHLVARCQIPIVLDADGLAAFDDAAQLGVAVAQEGRTVVLTPHDGEYRALSGGAPGSDRVEAARRLAAATGAVVLLKGSLTAVATPSAPSGEPSVWLAAAGSSVLATAGTGDVLSGLIGAFVARGLPASVGAVLAAHVHGRAAREGHVEGLVAPDLPALIADWLSNLFASSKSGG